MDADETLGIGGYRSEARDRNRGRIRRDDGVRLEKGAQGSEDLALDLFVLGGRLDDEIALAELVEGRGYLNAIEDRLALRFAHLSLGHLARQMAVDGRESRVNPLLGDVGERDDHSCLSGDLGDAGAHLASADHANRFN